MDKMRLLFVCLGNICRSPSAEAVMNAVVEKHGAAGRFEIDSAGIIGVHEGEPADSRMKRFARKRGYQLNSISRPVNPDVDFEYFDLVVAMDDENVRDLLAMAPDEAARAKVVKMTDYAQSMGYDEVPDPYYGGEDGFILVLDLLEDACEGLYQQLTS